MTEDRNAIIKSSIKGIFLSDIIIILSYYFCSGGLPYWHYYPNGSNPPHCESSGLLLLSKYPIEEVSYWEFSINGKPHKVKQIFYNFNLIEY